MGISVGCKVHGEDFNWSIDPEAAKAFLPYTEGTVKAPSSLALFFHGLIRFKCNSGSSPSPAVTSERKHKG